MPQEGDLVNLTLQIDSDEDLSSGEVDSLQRQLYQELRCTDVETVELVQNEPPPEGTKGAPIGVEIAVALLAPMIPETISYVYHWVKRREDQRVVIKSVIGGNEVEIIISGKGDSTEQINNFMDAYSKAVGENTSVQ